jgi:hypothetical protein
MLFEYIDFLWNEYEYVVCPMEDLGETGKMQRELLLELISVSRRPIAGQSFSIAFVSITLGYGA